MATQKRQRKKTGRQARQQAIEAERRRRSRRRSLVIVVVLVAIAALIASVTGAFSSGSSSSNKAAAPKPPSCPKADGSSPKTTTFSAPPPMCIDPAKTYTATMQTSQGGPITIAFDAKQAPKSVNNFVFLARYHFYDGLTFHRVVKGFVIQGGDPLGTGNGDAGYKFVDEKPAGPYKEGSLAMANSGPNTNGSQFFIVVSDDGGKQLQPLYNLFGNVTAGMDVVKKIEALAPPTPQGGQPPE